MWSAAMISTRVVRVDAVPPRGRPSLAVASHSRRSLYACWLLRFTLLELAGGGIAPLPQRVEAANQPIIELFGQLPSIRSGYNLPPT